MLEHRLPLRLRCVAGADLRPHFNVGQPLLRQRRADFRQRLREVLLDVV